MAYFLKKNKIHPNKNFEFELIKSNINNFFKNNYGNSIRDFLIVDDTIYISLVGSKKLTNFLKRCYYNEVLESKLTLDNLLFKSIFKTNCHYTKEYTQVGGRLSNYKNNSILLSTGDYRSYAYTKEKAQKLDNYLGKIIKLNINNFDEKPKILSLGLRNPIGLFYNFQKDQILITSNGPKGGDELNINFSPSEKIKNYGWPVASYGEHYRKYSDRSEYYKAPLYKNKKKFNFELPLIYWNPAIAPSQIISINNPDGTTNLIMGTLKEKTLFIIVLNKKNQITSIQKLLINERIRDVFYSKELNKILLFLDTTQSIAVLNNIFN